ncbi:hypothetical protein AVEN_55623-1, partial [Araneus ventricosus]
TLDAQASRKEQHLHKLATQADSKSLTIKLRPNGLSFHKFRPRFALFPVVGTGRIDVTRGIVSASVVSRIMAVNSSRIKGTNGAIASVHSNRDICKATRRKNGATVRIQPTTVHKYEPRATRDLAKPHAVGTRLYSNSVNNIAQRLTTGQFAMRTRLQSKNFSSSVFIPFSDRMSRHRILSKVPHNSAPSRDRTKIQAYSRTFILSLKSGGIGLTSPDG